MERRNFLRLLMGGASATVAPSLVWPFRKFFLPSLWAPSTAVELFEDIEEYDALSMAAVEAIELESFAKQIPDTFYRSNSLYKLFHKESLIGQWEKPAFRIPMRVTLS